MRPVLEPARTPELSVPSTTLPAGVTGTSTGVSTTNVHASLDDLRALSAMLNRLGDSCIAQSARVALIDPGLPSAAVLLAPVSATQCTLKILNLTVGFKSLAVLGAEAKTLGALVMASVVTYEASERAATSYIERETAAFQFGAAITLLAATYVDAAAHGRPLDLATVQREHPETIDLLTSSLSSAVPGSYTQDLSTVYAVVERISGRPQEVHTTMVASPGSYDAPPVSRSISESFGRQPDLYDNADHKAHLEVQRVVDPATGKGAWTVIVPGTSTWSWNADNPFDLTGNLAAQGGQVSAGETAVIAAVKQAMAAEGVAGKGEPVMVIGHSQGGIVAANVARRRGTGLNVTRVATFGSPVGHLPPPPGTQMLNVENTKDPVARLDGFATGQGEPRRTRVVLDDPGSLTDEHGKADPIEAHDVTRYRRDYEGYVNQQRGNASAPVTAFEQQSKQFYTGTAHTYRFDATRQAADAGSATSVQSAPSAPPEPQSTPSAPRPARNPSGALHERQFGR